MKIEFIPVDVESQKIKKARPCYIELFDDRFIHHFDADISAMKNPDDELLGWDDSTLFFHNTVLKSAVVMVEKSLSENQRWVVGVAANGIGQDFVIYFNREDEKKADEMFEKIEAWILKK